MSDLYTRLTKLSKQETAQLKSDLDSISEYDLEQQYQDMLDDIYGEVRIAGYSYATSDALKQTDPTAYRCGFSDFLSDTEVIIEVNGDYYNSEEVEAYLDNLDNTKS